MEQALTVYRHMLEIYVDALDIHTEIILFKTNIENNFHYVIMRIDSE